MKDMNKIAERARSGDRQAFAMLYEEVYQDLYRYAVWMLGHREDAEDAVADTVMDAFRQIGSLRSAEAFRGWIFRILSNKCRMVRKSYLQKTEELEANMAGPGRDFTDDVMLGQLWQSLDQQDQEIISLHLFGGYTSKEIGEILGMNDATVRSREHRALARLRKEAI